MVSISVVQSAKSSRRDLVDIARSCAFPVLCYESLVEFLPNAGNAEGCLLIDSQELDAFLREYQLQDSFFDYFLAYNASLPVIVSVAADHVSDAVKLMRSGAYGVVGCNDTVTQICQEINSAVESNLLSQQVNNEVKCALQSFGKLSENEKDVLACFMRGYQAKQIAALLEIGRRTVDNRKKSVMKKFQSNSFPQLIRQVLLVELQTGRNLLDRVERLIERRGHLLASSMAESSGMIEDS